MLAVVVDRAGRLEREWRQEKEKAGTQGVGLVVGRLQAVYPWL
jgi:hypothetical protein